jgi:hypothetical protein
MFGAVEAGKMSLAEEPTMTVPFGEKPYDPDLKRYTVPIFLQYRACGFSFNVGDQIIAKIFSLPPILTQPCHCPDETYSKTLLL